MATKRKPTPAQIAARERFAEMARSGAFKKKAAKAKKATDDTRTVSQKLKEYAINNAILERVESGQSVKSAYDAVLGKGAYERLAGELYGEIRKTKSNPAKKTVSQKISQLTREGYPQKQAVAIALSEERAGKVKRNPRASNPIILVSDKAIASKRKRNPTKRANPMIKYALVPDDGGFTFGMDDRTPVQFVFSNRDKVRGVYRSFALPKSVTSSPDFQQWASSLPGQSIIVSLNDLRKMLKRYV